MSRTLTLLAAALFGAPLLAQYAPPDPAGFEGIIVERYYVSDANDAADEDGSTDLDAGEVTYRVFVDLLPGYKLITVGGFAGHPLTYHTTTSFFYNDDRGESWGGDINDIHLNKNTVAIDSWLSMGASTDAYWGVTKDEDTDGSVVGGTNNDGGSNGVAGGLLVNEDANAGIPLTEADGLMAGTPPGILSVGETPTVFNDYGGADYSSENFAWSSSDGNIEGPTASNRILIGQFTTDGTFTFCLNLWVRIPDELVCNDPNCHEIMEFYGDIIPSDTLGGGFNADKKFSHPTLCFDSGMIVDCENVPGGPALPGTPCDDADEMTINDTWNGDCACIGSPVGINEQYTSGPAVNVHPNPANDRVWVEVANAEGARVTVQLSDAAGKRILVRDLGVQGASWKGAVDLSDMASGVYFLQVDVDGQRTVRRISKL